MFSSNYVPWYPNNDKKIKLLEMVIVVAKVIEKSSFILHWREGRQIHIYIYIYGFLKLWK